MGLRVTDTYNAKGERIRTTRENITELQERFKEQWEIYNKAAERLQVELFKSKEPKVVGLKDVVKTRTGQWKRKASHADEDPVREVRSHYLPNTLPTADSSEDDGYDSASYSPANSPKTGNKAGVGQGLRQIAQCDVPL